jgi:hypothetical protein
MSDYGFLPECRDPIITGGAADIARIGDAIATQLRTGWLRDRAREKERGPIEGSLDLAWLVFNRDATPDIPAASLLMTAQDNDLAVTNIVPQSARAFPMQQYNRILAESFETAAEPACHAPSLRCTLTEDALPVAHWVSEEAASRLLRFSDLANRATGAAHPLDRKRWFAFIFETVKDESSLDAGTLGRWLISIGRWPDASAPRSHAHLLILAREV